jgi:hypothetical protein
MGGTQPPEFGLAGGELGIQVLQQPQAGLDGPLPGWGSSIRSSSRRPVTPNRSLTGQGCPKASRLASIRSVLQASRAKPLTFCAAAIMVAFGVRHAGEEAAAVDAAGPPDKDAMAQGDDGQKMECGGTSPAQP